MKLAIKEVRIITAVIRGDEIEELIWCNQCGEAEWHPRDRRSSNPDFQEGVQVSNASVIYERLIQHIKDNNESSFLRLLQLYFIYPGLVRYECNDNPCIVVTSASYYYQTSEIYKGRRNIEALLIDRPDYFEKLVDALLEKDNPALYKAFTDSLEKIGFKSLLDWNLTIKSNILNKLGALERYGKDLLKSYATNAQRRGTTAITLTKSLSDKVTSREEETALPGNMKANVQNVKFKLQILRELHSKDSEFEAHRGWKHIITNICSFLFTGGIANGINYMATGSLLFFKKTTTQNKIMEAQAAIGIDPKENIKFKS